MNLVPPRAGKGSLRERRSEGRAPYVEGLGAETIGLEMDGPFIRVTGRMETNVDGVYAIGDVIGKMMLAHTA